MRRENWNGFAVTVAVVAITLGALGCAMGRSSVMLVSHGGIPAAQGSVTTSATHDGNTLIVIQVKHLASPERVVAGATTYVVWARPAGQRAVANIGALHVDEELTGTLNTLTAFQNFEVFITAEPSPRVSEPTGGELLAASVSGKQS